jgi:predicted extracellular nuclease
MKRFGAFCTAISSAALALMAERASLAATYVIDDFDGGADPRLISSSFLPVNGTPHFPGSIFDVFGPTTRSVNTDFADDSAGTFPADVFGIVPSGKLDVFFGVEDLLNPNHGGGGSATWTFDISGLSGLQVEIDFSAMGDFESGDNSHSFTFRIDGVPAGQLSINSNDAAVGSYTMEGGAIVSLADPLELSDDLGTRMIKNDFSTRSQTALTGTGSVLEISYVAGVNDGGSEPFAFDNLTLRDGVVVTPTPRAIPELQGPGAATPFPGDLVSTSGVVVGDFQGIGAPNGQLGGFFLQDPVGDANPATSDGIFVASTLVDVAVGDLVTVVGRAVENAGHTELQSVTSISIAGSAPLPAPTPIALPEPVNGDLERFEGMLVSPPSGMTLQQNFFQGRYGQLTLASPDDFGVPGRLYQSTQRFDAGSPARAALADENERRLIVLDDGQDQIALGDNPVPVPYLSQPVGDPPTFPPAVLRAGDAVANLVGCIDYGLITTPTSSNRFDYRLHPTSAPNFTAQNPRPAPPALVGSLRVISANVLNYFTTLGSRGADTASELSRQRAKLVSAILGSGAAIAALQEVENGDTASADLSASLNAVAGPGTFAFVPTGVVGGDEIKVAFLYRPAIVTPIGPAAILDDSVNPAAISTKNRPAIAQTFEVVATGGRLTLVNNHFKSKGSNCNVATPGTNEIVDPDLGDGQGNCNLTRTSMANALVAWLATDPTGTGDPDFLILGDLNSYAEEDPIQALEAAGFSDLAEHYVGPNRYSFVFDGQSGTLDYALVNAALLPQVLGLVEWHINADEPAVINYDQSFNPPGYYSPDAFRSADHDPIVIAVPEPAALAGLCAGASGLAALARRRERQQRGRRSMPIS